MKKTLYVLVIFSLMVIKVNFVLAQNNYLDKYYKSTSPIFLEKEFKNKNILKEKIKQNKNNPMILFQAGVYYMYQVYGVLNSMEVNRKNEKEFTEKAKRLFKKAYNQKSTNPVITAWLGSATLYSSKWGSPFNKMRNGKKGYFYLDKALQLAPNNIQVRAIRIRSIVNLPPKYFPGVLKDIKQDTKFLIEKIENDKKLLNDKYFKTTLYLCYFYRARTLIRLKENKKEAYKLLEKIPKESLFYSKAINLKEKNNKNKLKK
ncbi:MAG: hypothetical protein ACOC56_04380 [Atribacterota bacterium]